MPLCFTIHGGGFIMGTPQDNDAWNAKFASRYSATVVALNYNKAPKTTFPMSIHVSKSLNNEPSTSAPDARASC